LLRNGFDAASLYRVAEEPAELVLVEVPGAATLETWQRLRDLMPETGRWPIVVGDMDEAGLVFEGLGGDFDPRLLLETSLAIDPSRWAADLRQTDPELYTPLREEPTFRDRVFLETEPRRELMLHLDVQNNRPVDQVGIVLVPTERSWEAPAWLNYGGWNECPHPEVHVAFLRRWHELYGAEVVAIGPDVMELSIARPVTCRDEALALADEQFLYCYDIVTQGTETLDRLAAHLLRATVWYFWWD
jgi:hypothetical protein